MLAVSNGKMVRILESDIRPLSRVARGVKGINTGGGEVIGMATNDEGKYILTVSQNGFGKKTLIDEYRITKRGAKGVKAANVTEKTGSLVVMKAVNGDEDCMIMTNTGIVIRISLMQVGTYSRNAIGVKLINVKDDQIVSTVAIVDKQEEPAETTEETEETTEQKTNELTDGLICFF